MAFSTQALKYGWAALASLGVVTGTTIYVVNNLRHQVKPEDIIELALGTHERDLARGGVGLSVVRTWTSNVYTTNGVTIYTNVVTNTIGWGLDRDMMVSLDTTIKQLIPYYLDTNTLGTYLTVTGLWASLGIGDGTNKFTSTPAIGTNTATYGALPWQIYEEDLVERYKVLNSLKKTSPTVVRLEPFAFWFGSGIGATMTIARNAAISDFSLQYTNGRFIAFYQGSDNDFISINEYGCQLRKMVADFYCVTATNISHSVEYWMFGNNDYTITEWHHDGQGLGVTEQSYALVDSVGWSSSASNIITFGGTVSDPPNAAPTPTATNDNIGQGFVFLPDVHPHLAVVEWQFLYATNKFW